MTVVIQGRDPRRALLFRVTSGSKQVVSAVYSASVIVDSGAGPQKGPPIPATRIKFVSRVHSMTPEGDVRYEFLIDSVDLLVQPNTPKPIVDEVTSSLSLLTGLAGTGQSGRRGNSLELKLPAGLAPRRRKELLDMAAALRFAGNPFPQEPIGAGARWEEPLYSPMPFSANGTASFELVSIAKDRVTTRFLAQQTIRDQPIPTEYRAPGARGERMMVRSQTKGETVFSLDRIWPVRSEMETRVQEDLSSEKGEAPRRLQIVTETKMQIEEW